MLSRLMEKSFLLITSNMTFERVIQFWNEKFPDRKIVGMPGIDYLGADAEKPDGILLPGEFVKIKDGTKFLFTVDHSA